MSERKRAPIIRARQRSRTSLSPFNVPLNPSIEEVAVDRMQIKVSGSWRLDQQVSARPTFSATDYRAQIQREDTRRDWFCKPANGYGGAVVLQTKKDAATTLGHLKATIDGWGAGRGQYSLTLHCNPTRTLAHLLSTGHEYPNFVEGIRAMPPFTFFERRAIPQFSLDVKDNWLADLDAAHHFLGADIFGTFFPIFVLQVQKLAVAIFAPFEGVHIEEDGTDQLFGHEALRGRLEWGSAQVPQIETYFERHYSGARNAVRRVGQRVLLSLDEGRVRHHLHHVSFERVEDVFAIRTELPADRDLSVYAKAPHRLRFEVARVKRGRYRSAFLQAPADRLMQIFDSERSELPECCDWDGVAELFSEPELPLVDDLVELVSAVATACASEGVAPRAVFAALFSSGGLHADAIPEVSSGLISRLVRSGLIERVTLRRRDKSGAHRYALRGIYRAAFDEVLSALAGHDREQPLPEPMA